MVEVQAEEISDFEFIDQQEMAILTKEASQQAIDPSHINTVEILQGGNSYSPISFEILTHS